MSELLRDLPGNLSNHLELTVIALVAGVILSVPAALVLVRRPAWRYPVLTLASVIQTVPSLALLALMVPVLARTGGLGVGLPAFGFYPAVFALTLYSLLPILRNAVTGMVNVDADITEAARGMGMTGSQIMLYVELPLAAPVIIAGIRTATVWVVGMATLATPVGQRCLGNYIFAGLQTKNWAMVMFGVACAAGLAIVLDVLIGGLERAALRRSRGLAWVTGSGLVLVLLAGLIAPRVVQWAGARQGHRIEIAAGRADSAPDSAPVGTIRIGAKTFTEQYILVALIEQTLEARGFPTTRAEGLGSTIVFDALRNGDIDVYVDYSGTIWANYMKRGDTAAPWRVLMEMDAWLAREHGVRDLGSLGFENAYALAMRRDRAAALGVQSIVDVAGHAHALAIGADYEFFSRPEWRRIRDTYGLGFGSQTSYDPTLMYDAVQTGQVDVIAAFSSDGRIAAHDLVLLRDPAHVIPPYDAVLLLGPRIADHEGVAATLEPLIRAIPVATMQRANLMVDRDQDKKTPAQAAAWLAEQMRP
jgi:osmoprotectant transport system permease protein